METRDRPSGVGVMNAKGTWLFFSDLLLASSKACWDSWIPAINSMPQTNMEGTSLDNIQAEAH